MSEKEVTRIHNPVKNEGPLRQKKRVFCYLRVSTDTQETSMESQMEGFNLKIAANPDWELSAEQGRGKDRSSSR